MEPCDFPAAQLSPIQFDRSPITELESKLTNSTRHVAVVLLNFDPAGENVGGYTVRSFPSARVYRILRSFENRIKFELRLRREVTTKGMTPVSRACKLLYPPPPFILRFSAFSGLLMENNEPEILIKGTRDVPFISLFLR